LKKCVVLAKSASVDISTMPSYLKAVSKQSGVSGIPIADGESQSTPHVLNHGAKRQGH
jgi:hypothetical protein